MYYRYQSAGVCTYRELLAVAEGMNVTFHRAFDLAKDPQAALADLVSSVSLHHFRQPCTFPNIATKH
jgi:hypothetical protein